MLQCIECVTLVPDQTGLVTLRERFGDYSASTDFINVQIAFTVYVRWFRSTCQFRIGGTERVVPVWRRKQPSCASKLPAGVCDLSLLARFILHCKYCSQKRLSRAKVVCTAMDNISNVFVEPHLPVRPLPAGVSAGPLHVAQRETRWRWLW